MSGSVNKVILIGRLGADPDIRRMNNGDSVVNLSVATSERWTDKNTGEKREKTEWHKVVIFNEQLGKVAETYLRKGANVYLEGQLQTRSWEDQSGQKKYVTEIVMQRYRGELQMLDSFERKELPQKAQDQSGGDYSAASGGGYSPELEDEVPFAMEWRG